jgi:Glycosyltransferase family 87
VLDNQKQVAAASRMSQWRYAHVFIIGVLCLQLVFVMILRERIGRGYPDFTVFFTAAKILRAGLGHQLYDLKVQYEVQKQFTSALPSRRGPLPYIHTPFEALIFVPFTFLPYLPAYLVWDSLNFAFLALIAFLLRPYLSTLRFIPAWQFVLTSLAFFPIFECLLQGQDSILQLLLCVLAWKALKKNADILAGCWLALAAFKFQFMLPILLLMFLWNRRRTLIGFLAVSIVLGTISIGLVGWEGLLRYPAFAVQITKMPGLGGVLPSFLPNLHGLVAGWPFYFVGTTGTVVIGLISVGLLFLAAVKGRSAVDQHKFDLQFSLAVAVSGLVAWHTNIHDLSLLLLPLALITDYCLRMEPPPSAHRFALLFPVLPVLISPLWFVLWLATGTVNLMAIPVLVWTWCIAGELSRNAQTTVRAQSAM